MSISKDVIKQCLISKQREVDEAVIVNRAYSAQRVPGVAEYTVPG